MLIKNRKLLFSMIFIAVIYLIWAVSIPTFESPDEPSHIKYSGYIASHRKLPNMFTLRDGAAHHAPLYYVLFSPVYRIFADSRDITQGMVQNITQKMGKNGKKQYIYAEPHEGQFRHSPADYKKAWLPVRALRIANLLCPILTLIIIFFAARSFLNDNKLLKYALIFFTGLIPQFTFIESAFSSDNLAVLVSTATIFTTLLSLKNKKHYWLIGLLLGLGYLAKSSTYFLLAFVPLTILLFDDGALKERIRKILIVIAVFVFVILPYSIYLFLTYGDFTSGRAAQMALASMKRPPFSWQIINTTIAHFFDSFFAWFGWLAVRLPNGFYNIFTLFTLFALIGCFIKRNRFSIYEKILGLAFLCELVFFIALHMKYGINVTGDQGRHLYVTILPISYFLLTGFGTFIDSVSRMFKKSLNWDLYYISVIPVMILLNIYSLIVMIKGLY